MDDLVSSYNEAYTERQTSRQTDKLYVIKIALQKKKKKTDI